MPIGLIYDRFLPLSETFLLHERRGLQAAGVPLHTYALSLPPADQNCATPAEQAQVHKLELTAGALAFKTGFYLRHPIRGTSLAGVMLGATAHAYPSAFSHLWRSNHLFSLMRRLKADGVTHLHASFLGLPATLAWCVHRLTGMPFSISAHARDVWSEDFATPAKVAAADRVFVCNEAARQELLRRFPQHAAKLVLAPHGIPMEEPPLVPAPSAGLPVDDPPPQAWLNGTRHKLLAVGRLVEKKGFHYLIDACDVLRQHQLDFGVAIVGAGPLLQTLGAKIKDRNLTDRVDLLGAQPASRVQALMRQADLLVVPSSIAADNDRDGVPNVILEAFNTGLPVLGTPVGGIPEVLIPDQTGFLALDHFPSALIAGIHQALETPPATRKAMAINAKFWLQENRDLTQCVEPLATYFRNR